MNTHDSVQPVQQISRDELLDKRRQGDAFVLVDVLSHDHFTRVHLPGAVNIPVNLLHDLAPLLLSPLDEIIVYCGNFDCNASTSAAKILLRLGYEHVSDYKGGINDWEDGNLPVLRGALLDEVA